MGSGLNYGSARRLQPDIGNGIDYKIELGLHPGATSRQGAINAIQGGVGSRQTRGYHGDPGQAGCHFIQRHNNLIDCV